MFKFTTYEEKIENYPLINRELLSYICYVREEEEDLETSLLDIVMDFCIKTGIDYEFVGDSISEDYYLKNYIQHDCQLKNIIPADFVKLEDW